MLRYLYQLVLPFPLKYDYSFNAIPILKEFTLSGILSMVGLVTMTIAGLKLFFQKKWLGFSLLFYLASLVLFSNIFILIGALYAERFAFFAVLPFCILISEGLFLLNKKSGKIVFWGLTIMLISVYSFLTIQRNPDWKNNETLYRHDLVLQPNSAKTHYYLGNELIKAVAPAEQDSAKRTKIFLEAIDHLNNALAIYPNYPDGFTQIGVGYYKMNRLNEAGGYFEKALSLDPNSKVALNNLASILFNQNKIEQALSTYQRVLAIDPNFVDAWLNIGSCYGMLKNYPKAIEAFEKCLSFSPNNEKAWRFLSITYGFTGDKAKADEALKQADALR